MFKIKGNIHKCIFERVKNSVQNFWLHQVSKRRRRCCSWNNILIQGRMPHILHIHTFIYLFGGNKPIGRKLTSSIINFYSLEILARSAHSSDQNETRRSRMVFQIRPFRLILRCCLFVEKQRSMYHVARVSVSIYRNIILMTIYLDGMQMKHGWWWRVRSTWHKLFKELSVHVTARKWAQVMSCAILS